MNTSSYFLSDMKIIKQSVIYIELFALHVHFICVGRHIQYKVKKRHGVIWAKCWKTNT